MVAICCCALAGTAACQHCANNPLATDVWSNKTITVDRVEAKPFGNGLDVCPVCGKPSTISKPKTNADRIRSMSDEELADVCVETVACFVCPMTFDCDGRKIGKDACKSKWIDWLRKEVE